MFQRLGEIPSQFSFVLKNNTGNQATKGTASLAAGVGTVAAGNFQTALGRYNVPSQSLQFAIGNGTDKDNRSNAFEVDADGVGSISGGDVMMYDENTDQRLQVYAIIRNKRVPVRFASKWTK